MNLAALVPTTTDLWATLGWGAVLGAGLAVVVLLHRRGLPTDLCRDALHLGAGSWALSFLTFDGPAVPLALTLCAAGATALVPRLARRFRPADTLLRSVAGGQETWTGLSFYAASLAALTLLGWLDAPFPAAGAVASLAIGDGLGGFVGTRLRGPTFRLPWSKPKTVAGSLAVAAGAFAACLVAGLVYAPGAAPLGSLVARAALAALAGALAEALSPRGTDNLILPAAVWAALRLL
jgi:dolichol kinase